MKQQSLEEKMFANEPLNSAEKRELEIALKANPELSSLRDSWQAIETQLSTKAMSFPQPGFKQRWLSLQQQDQQQKEKTQAAWLGFFNASMAVGILALLIIRLSPSIEGLKDLFLGTLNGVAEVVAFMQIVVMISLSLLQKVPAPMWAGIGAIILVLPIVWFAVFRELTFSKGVY
jgi:hypothetical protein